jgi:hypothetical protein
LQGKKIVCRAMLLFDVYAKLVATEACSRYTLSTHSFTAVGHGQRCILVAIHPYK